MCMCGDVEVCEGGTEEELAFDGICMCMCVDVEVWGRGDWGRVGE